MSQASRTSSFAITSATGKRRRRPPVWFSSIYLKTLRGLRTPILGWGLGLGALFAVVLAAIPTVLGTAAARAQARYSTRAGTRRGACRGRRTVSFLRVVRRAGQDRHAGRLRDVEVR